jgi:hypothetical protein
MTAPEPDGLRDEPLALGEWIPFGAGSIAALPYETVRTAPDPRATLLGFCQSAYEAGARRADWDTTGFASKWCPTAGQLQELQLSAAADLGAPTGAWEVGGWLWLTADRRVSTVIHVRDEDGMPTYRMVYGDQEQVVRETFENVEVSREDGWVVLFRGSDAILRVHEDNVQSLEAV